MNDPYAQVANQFSQELGRGVQYADRNSQMLAQQPQTLYDRFMAQYQRQYQQKMAEQEMQRKQQHEDTYLKMAEDAEEKSVRASQATYAKWLHENYKEGENDSVARVLGKFAGFEDEAIESMLPKGAFSVPDQGETLPLPGGGEVPMPQTSADIQKAPGVGGGRRMMEEKAAELARKTREDEAIRRESESGREQRAAQAWREREDAQGRALSAQEARDERRHQQTLATIGARGGGGSSLAERKFGYKMEQDQKKEDRTAREQEMKGEGLLDSLDQTDRVIQSLLNNPEGVAGIAGKLDQYKSLDFKKNTLKARADFENLNARNVIGLISEMKAMSRTGATGWGAVSERELAIMESAMGRMSTAQSDSDFIQALKDLSETYNKARSRIRKAQSLNTPSPVPSSESSGPAVDSVEDGYRFNGGDPKDKANWTKVR